MTKHHPDIAKLGQGSGVEITPDMIEAAASRLLEDAEEPGLSLGRARLLAGALLLAALAVSPHHYRKLSRL